MKKKLKQLPPINFDECTVKPTSIAKNLIQIHADEAEVMRRVDCFVKRKREEINANNVQDFTDATGSSSLECPEETCARTNGSVFRTKDSNSHLKSK